jgi:hypothetical protein
MKILFAFLILKNKPLINENDLKDYKLLIYDQIYFFSHLFMIINIKFFYDYHILFKNL